MKRKQETSTIKPILTMNIYSFRTRVRRMRFRPCNYYEAFLLPTIVVGKSNEIDYRKTSFKFGDQEATLYYIDFLWLNFAFILEFWGDREKKGGKQ